jgi:hypothetical protein
MQKMHYIPFLTLNLSEIESRSRCSRIRHIMHNSWDTSDVMSSIITPLFWSVVEQYPG